MYDAYHGAEPTPITLAVFAAGFGLAHVTGGVAQPVIPCNIRDDLAS